MWTGAEISIGDRSAEPFQCVGAEAETFGDGEKFFDPDFGLWLAGHVRKSFRATVDGQRLSRFHVASVTRQCWYGIPKSVISISIPTMGIGGQFRGTISARLVRAYTGVSRFEVTGWAQPRPPGWA